MQSSVRVLQLLLLIATVLLAQAEKERGGPPFSDKL